MEVDERPTEQYSDIGGLDKQIQEVGVDSVTLGFYSTSKTDNWHNQIPK